MELYLLLNVHLHKYLMKAFSLLCIGVTLNNSFYIQIYINILLKRLCKLFEHNFKFFQKILWQETSVCVHMYYSDYLQFILSRNGKYAVYATIHIKILYKIQLEWFFFIFTEYGGSKEYGKSYVESAIKTHHLKLLN